MRHFAFVNFAQNLLAIAQPFFFLTSGEFAHYLVTSRTTMLEKKDFPTPQTKSRMQPDKYKNTKKKTGSSSRVTRMGVRGGDAAYLEVLTSVCLGPSINAAKPLCLSLPYNCVYPRHRPTSSPHHSYLAQNKTSTNCYNSIIYNVIS